MLLYDHSDISLDSAFYRLSGPNIYLNCIVCLEIILPGWCYRFFAVWLLPASNRILSRAKNIYLPRPQCFPLDPKTTRKGSFSKNILVCHLVDTGWRKPQCSFLSKTSGFWKGRFGDNISHIVISLSQLRPELGPKISKIIANEVDQTTMMSGIAISSWPRPRIKKCRDFEPFCSKLVCLLVLISL